MVVMYHPLPLRWWHIYARFKVADEQDEAFAFPHLGQVAGYYRRLHRQTRKEVAEALGWSEGYVRKVEANAHQPEKLERRIALARSLQIPPMLMRIPTRVFEKEEVLSPPPLMTEAEREQLMATELPLDEKLHRLEENLQNHIRHVFVRSYPLSLETLAVYGEALESAQQLFTRERSSDGEYRNWQDLIIDTVSGRQPFLERNTQPYLSDQIQLALSNVDFWLAKLHVELEYARGYRYDQMLFLQYQFCDLVNEATKYSRELEAAIDSERALYYTTLAVSAASRLGNAEYAGKALLQRASLYLEQNEYAQALTDVEQMLFYCEVLMDAMDDDSIPVFLACNVGRLLWRIKNKAALRKLQALHQKARRIAQITHEDLTRTTV
jgi:transcriptional regulator with XRE-family HTH domain